MASTRLVFTRYPFLSGVLEPGDDYTTSFFPQPRKRSYVSASIRNRLIGFQSTGLSRGKIDTQDYDFWYWIHAVGYGRNPQRWLIRCGKLDYFEDIRQVVLTNPNLDIHANNYPVQQAVQDYQGHRASKIFDFCVTTGGIILPARGERSMALPYDTTPVEFYPGSEKKNFPGALRIVRGNSTFYKDKADGILRTNRDGPGGLAFHSTIPDSDIGQHVAEVRNEDGFWDHESSLPNHLEDCFYNALIAEDILGVKWWPEPDEEDEYEDDCVVSSVSATMG